MLFFCSTAAYLTEPFEFGYFPLEENAMCVDDERPLTSIDYIFLDNRQHFLYFFKLISIVFGHYSGLLQTSPETKTKH